MREILFNIIDNPILLRELRRRMRGRALIWSIMTYISLMTLVTIMALVLKTHNITGRGGIQDLLAMKEAGSMVYGWITGIQILLVLIIAPTITAGMTTGEKERKTFDFLKVTTITRWMYILGCFLSTSFYVGVALLCALPLLSLGFLYGGVSLDDVTTSFFILLAGSCVLSSFGLYVSSVCERTRTAQGIIVFLIFTLLFAGFLSYRVYTTSFAGGTNVTSDIYLFNMMVPGWFVVVLGQLALTGIFLLLAARKLFEPEEMKAFSHSQFVLLLLAGFILGLGFLGANQFQSETPELFFLSAGVLALFSSVATFAVSRMEVGDEIWHLKRLFPFLRSIDQTIPFLLLVAVLWYGMLSLYPSFVPNSKLSATAIEAFAMPSTMCFLFFCAIGRASTAYARNMRLAGIYTLSAMIGILVIGVPLMISIGESSLGAMGGLWHELSALSPFTMMLDIFRNPEAYRGTGQVPGQIAAWAYGLLFLLVITIGEYARYQRWKGFDYHYDMPSRAS